MVRVLYIQLTYRGVERCRVGPRALLHALHHYVLRAKLYWWVLIWPPNHHILFPIKFSGCTVYRLKDEGVQSLRQGERGGKCAFEEFADVSN